MIHTRLHPTQVLRGVQDVSAALRSTRVCVCVYSGPLLALALARKGAVHHWKKMLGPSDVNRAREESPEW